MSIARLLGCQVGKWWMDFFDATVFCETPPTYEYRDGHIFAECRIGRFTLRRVFTPHVFALAVRSAQAALDKFYAEQGENIVALGRH